MKGTKEWYEMIEAFEKAVKQHGICSCSFEKETDKNIPGTAIYQKWRSK